MGVAEVLGVLLAELDEGVVAFDFLEGDDVGVDLAEGFGGGFLVGGGLGVVLVFFAAGEGGVVAVVEEVFDVVGGEADGAGGSGLGLGGSDARGFGDGGVLSTP